MKRAVKTIKDAWRANIGIYLEGETDLFLARMRKKGL
jgi:hypothetical protein